jgi:hypothetical protein
MPKITAHGKILRDWDALLGAVDANASLLPGVDDLKAGLEKLLTDGRAAKVQQASLGSTRQAETQNVNKILADGSEMARKLRAFVFSHLGSQTDLVKQFGLPIKKKSKKKAATPPPDAPAAQKSAAGGTPAVIPQTGAPQPSKAAEKAEP